MPARTLHALLLVLGAANAGCPSHPLERPDINLDTFTPVEVPLSLERDLDILFQIDTSNSMQGEQELLARQFPLLMLALNRLDGGFPNAHIGVVSPDLGAGQFSILTCDTPGGEQGRLNPRPNANCPAAPIGAPFIRVTNNGGVLEANVPDTTGPILDDAGNVTGCPTTGRTPNGQIDACDIAESFICMGRLGTGGCGFEQQLEASVQALCTDTDELDPPAKVCNAGKGGPNGGFLRPDSLLAVVYVTDEDDCSAQNGNLFDPTDTDISDRLGPLQSFRCWEFGYRCGDRCAYSTCDGPMPRMGGVTLADCRPADEDDVGSGETPWLYPVQRYTDFFKSFEQRRGPDKVLVASISGPWRPGEAVLTELDQQGNPDIAPSCYGGADGANQGTPALRLRTFINSMGENGVYGEDVNAHICSDSFALALDALAERIRSRLTPGCVPNGLINTEGYLIERPDEPQCTITEVRRAGSDDESTHTVPACIFEDAPGSACPDPNESPGAVTNAPCWYFCDSLRFDQDENTNTQACPPIDGLAAAVPGYTFRWQMRVCRDGECNPATPAPENTTAQVQCSTCNAQINCRRRGEEQDR